MKISGAWLVYGILRIMSLDGRVVLLSSLEENTDTFIVHDIHQISLGDLQGVKRLLW